ncbi:MAG: pitrilysin family protein [Xanthomonadales bacterium]|nr:pitrilysin family protein [Xanthomonadales bacterium]
MTARRLLLALLLALLAAACERRAPVPQPPPAPPPEFVTEVEGIREFRLANGLRVLLVRDVAQPNVTINVTYLVGSRHEGYGESGMAHLLEHLLFKGTARFPDITGEIARRGGQANGTTSFDRTNYFQTFPATEENLRWALAMEADRMVNSLLRAEDLASEMTVVRNEWEAGESSPGSVLFKRTLGAAFQWHGYGRPTIGERSDIERVPIDRLRAFYRRHYQPDNALLILSGRFEEPAALALIAETFGRIPRPEREGELRLWPTYTREPTQDGERRVTVRRVGDNPLVAIVHRIPAAAHPDAAALSVLAEALDAAPSGRLYKALVESGLAASVHASAMELAEPSVFMILAELRAGGDPAAVEAAAIRTLEELAERPPAEEELRRARARLLRGFELVLNDGSRVGLALSEWAAAGDWRLMFLFRDRIERLGVEDLARVASTYFKPANRTVGVFLPDPAPDRVAIPEAEPVAEQLAGYRGRARRAEGERFEASPESIEARLIRSELPHGAKLWLLPKGTRGARVVGLLAMPLAGRSADWLPHAERAQGVASMLLRGTGRRDRQQIADFLAERKAVLGFEQAGEELVARIETTRDHLSEVLELLAEALTEPAFPESELEALRRERLAELESLRSEPAALAGILLMRHLSPVQPGDPDYVPTLEESIARLKALRREDLVAFHRSRYGFSPGSRIVLVGDFDADAVAAELATRFARFAASEPHQRKPRRLYEVAPRVLTARVADRPNAVLVGSLGFPVGEDHPDHPALLLANELLGGGFLNSRLAKRLRQRDGLSYAVGSTLTASPFEPVAHLEVFAIFAPANHARALAATREELGRAVREGFTAEELEQARQGWLQSWQVALGEDESLAALLAGHALIGRTMADEQARVRRIESLSAEEVSAALARWIDPERMSFALGGDLPAAEAQEAAEATGAPATAREES